MPFTTIETDLYEIAATSLTIEKAINNAYLHRGLTVRSFVFYDSEDNIVLPTTANIIIKTWLDIEDELSFRYMPFYSTNMGEGKYELVTMGTEAHLTSALAGISTIAQPVEKITIIFTNLTGVSKVKVKLLAIEGYVD